MRKILFFFLLAGTLSASAADYYVRRFAGNNSNDGKTWSTAWASFYNAWNKASAGDRIFLEADTFSVSGAYINKGLGFYGGYKVSGTGANLTVTRNQKSGGKPWEYEYETVINGTKTLRLIDFTDAAVVNPIEFEGITFMNGYTADPGTATSQKFHGGALRFSSSINVSGISIRKCKFLNNKAEKSTDVSNVMNGFGGAIYSEVDNTVIEDCYFFGNEANNGSRGGGALNLSLNYPKRAVINRCWFDSNKSNVVAGAVRLDGDGDYTLSNSVFYNNSAYLLTTAKEGGALFIYGVSSSAPQSYAVVSNCLFFNNGGTTTVSANGGVFKNITHANGARFIINNALTEVYNSIFYDVTTPTNVVGWWNASGTMKYCASAQTMTQANVSNSITINGVNSNVNGANFIQPTTFSGVATTDAQRLEILNSKWTLSSTSPIKAAGNLTYVAAGVDLAGNNRPNSGGSCSLGAYEYSLGTAVLPVWDDIATFSVVDNNFNVKSETPLTLDVYSLVGVRLKSEPSTVVHNVTLKAGIYIARLTSANGARYSHKFIIQ